MTTDPTPNPRKPGPNRRRRLAAIIVVAVAALVVVAVLAVVVLVRNHPPSSVALPLRQVGELPLPGDSSRFDYASLDPDRGLLFIAHLGASQVIEVDIHAGRMVRVIDGIDQVHGVLVVPARHRVYATATGTNRMVTLDEDTGQQLAHAPTGDYPDGLAYNPDRSTVWTTNETGGSETVIDADTNQIRGTVNLGGEAGNVFYDPVAKQMLVDVQTRNMGLSNRQDMRAGWTRLGGDLVVRRYSGVETGGSVERVVAIHSSTPSG